MRTLIIGGMSMISTAITRCAPGCRSGRCWASQKLPSRWPCIRSTSDEHFQRITINTASSGTTFGGNPRITPSQVGDGPKRLRGDRRDHTAFEAQMAEAGTFDCVIDMVCYKLEQADSAIRAFRGRTGQYIFCSTVDVIPNPSSVIRSPKMRNDNLLSPSPMPTTRPPASVF
jgi:hypothetical protein